MATTELEKLVLGALNLNDQTNFELTSLTFNPAQKRPQFVTNADADGEALVRESHYTPASFDLMVRVVPQSTADAGRAKLGELMDAVQACEKVEGGQAMPWTPNNSETTYTAYVLTGDATELPIEVAGDNAGWLLKGAWSPVVKIHLTCRPFLYTPERVVLSTTESGAEPLQVVYVKGIKGDVPAEARLIVTDKATQDRRFAMWGRDVVQSESNPAILLSAKSGLTGTGFSGEAKTRAGAYLEEKVLRGTAIPQATPICGTGRIENIGSYAIYLRVFSTSEATRFRVSYRSGDGPLVPMEWKQAPVTNGWSEMYMGSAALDAVALGAQTSEIRVEQKAAAGTPSNDVNYLELWPTKASGKARGLGSTLGAKLIAFDFFQSKGALSGKSANLGGVWSGVGSATDFTVEEVTSTGSGIVQPIAGRKAVSDAANTGRYAILGSAEYEAVEFSCAFGAQQTASPVGWEGSQFGVLLRYIDINNWFALSLGNWFETGGGKMLAQLKARKRVAGTVTDITVGSVTTLFTMETGVGQPYFTWNLSGYVRTDGTYYFQAVDPRAPATPSKIAGKDSALEVGTGALKKGKVGLLDEHNSSRVVNREFDNLYFYSPEQPARTCYSGRQIEFNPQGCLRQDSAGTYDGPPSSYRGGGFYLDPAGSLGLINRVAVRMRRNDDEVEEDSTVTDKHASEIRAKERFLLPR